jgi:O-antigen ligase
MPSKTTPAPNESWEGIFSGAAGLWLALALIKFGNPVILAQQIQVPANREEWVLYPWPVAWGYALLGLVAVLGLRFWRWQTPAPRWLIALPAVWLGWQALSGLQTVDRTLTTATLKHFCACVTAFYLGLFAFSRVSNLRAFWIGILGGFFVVVLVGWRQHFGGLEEARLYFYSLPDWQTYPPEFLKKVASNRIYSTLFYPNALAGVVILLLPPCLSVVWQASRTWPKPGQMAAVGTAGVLGLGCLYWSGSKAGWLIALGQGIAAFLHTAMPRKAKLAVVALLTIGGCAGFWLKYEGYFERGATSVAARFDYWQAGWETMLGKPLLGSGPGTFMVSYKSLKTPGAEMTRLAHNDFLEQGSDSGWIGLLAFAGWVFGAILLLYRRSIATTGQPFAVWVGLAGVILQGTVEFGLYIPAVSWTTFFLLGWLLGVCAPRNQFDKAGTAS